MMFCCRYLSRYIILYRSWACSTDDHSSVLTVYLDGWMIATSGAAYVAIRPTAAPNWGPLIRQDQQPVLFRAPLEFSQHAPRPGPDSKSAAGWPVNQKLRSQPPSPRPRSDSPPASQPHDETLLSITTTRWPASLPPIDLASELTTTTGPQQTREANPRPVTMSSAVVARPLLRQNLRFAARRFQTTDAASAQAKKAADATKETAQNVQSKAAQGLSRVTSAAGPALAGAANAAKGAASALGKVGGRTGRFVGFVERTSLLPSAAW